MLLIDSTMGRSGERIIVLAHPKPEATPRKSHTSPPPRPILHLPGHARTKNPMSISRNPVADQWRDGAYERWLAGADLIFDVERKQDRWKCEYCGHFNERGVTKPDPEEIHEGGTVDPTAIVDPNNPRISAAGPSTAPPGPANISPSATSDPVQIPGSQPSGVAANDLVRCGYCGEDLNQPDTLAQPRELVEAETYSKVLIEHMRMPAALDCFYKDAKGREAKRKVLERWREDLLREEAENEGKEREEAEKRDDDESAA
jgi:hypothetical protein